MSTFLFSTEKKVQKFSFYCVYGEMFALFRGKK